MPYEKAMTDMLTEAVAYMEDGVKVLWDWSSDVDNYIRTSPRYFYMMRKYAKKNNLPTVAELPDIFANDEKEAKEHGVKPLDKKHVAAAIKILNTDERIEKILTLSQDPGLNTALAEVKEAVECMKMLLASDKFPGVLKQIADMEYEKLSWSKTIGPACVAIIRLGKRSAGKDFEKLAEYARKHARRPT